MSRRALHCLLTACSLILLAVLGLATRRGMVRVGPDRFGIVGNRVLPPGWHLTSPFTRCEVVSERGEGALPPLPVSSREGVRGTAKLSFRFHADVPALARAASERSLGFHALLERAASEALQQTLTDRSAADF